MISHVVVGTNDLARAKAFYDPLMEIIGCGLTMEKENRVGYGPQGGGTRFIVTLPIDGGPATFANGGTIGLMAPDRAAVDAFHAKAVALGGKDEGGPGPRPPLPQDFYIAYLRDLDGNKLMVGCRG